MGIHNALYKSLAFGVSHVHRVAGASARSPSSSSPRQLRRVPSIVFLVASWWAASPRSAGLSTPLFIQSPEHRRRDLEGRPWAIFGVFMIGFVYLSPPASQAPSACFGRGGDPMKTRLVCVGAMLAAFAFRPRPKEVRPGASDTEVKVGNTNPTASGVGVRTIADHRRLFRMVNDQGAINGRRTFVSYDDGYSRQDVEMARKAGRAGQVLSCSRRSARLRIRHPQYMNCAGCRSCTWRPADQVERPKNFRDMGWQPNYQPRRRSTPTHPEDPARRRSRSLPERRLRQGLPQGLKNTGRPRMHCADGSTVGAQRVGTSRRSCSAPLPPHRLQALR